MDYGATVNVRGNAMRINAYPNIKILTGDKSGIVVGDVISLAIRHADAKWLERTGIHHLFDLFGIEHNRLSVSIFPTNSPFSRRGRLFQVAKRRSHEIADVVAGIEQDISK
jgi:hypothetical protein